MADSLSDARPIATSGDISSLTKEQKTKAARQFDWPLYISALIGILAAFTSVNTVLGSDTITWTTYAIAITGTAFSMFYRKQGLPPILLNISFVVAILVFLLCAKLGMIDINAIVPFASLQGDLTLAFFIQCVTALYTFIMIDDKRVLMSSIASMAMIGLVATYNIDGSLIFDFFVYMLATIFLLLHQSFQMFQVWGVFTLTGQRRCYLLLLQAGYSVIGASISLLVAMVLVTPLQAIGSHLSLASALRSLANLAPSNSAADAAQALAAPIDDDDTSTFAIGTGPTTEGDSRTPLLTMSSTDQQPHYLRGRTYDHYTGNGWISTIKTAPVPPLTTVFSRDELQYTFPSDPADKGIDPKNYGSPYTIFVEVRDYSSDSLYSVPNIKQIGLPFPEHFVVRLAADGQVQLPEAIPRVAYSETCPSINVSPAQLMKSRDTNYPPDIQRLYIDQKGENIDPSDALLLSKTAMSIVHSLPANHRTEFYEAYAIQNWVAKQAQYSLAVTPIPAGKDAVTYFLFTAREGYCDLFASSMAVLCRYAGIPARVVTGFDSGQPGRRGYFYTEADRHAWVEVYMPGYGWQQFDPTMGSALARARNTEPPFFVWLSNQIDFLLHGPSQATLVPRILTLLSICAIVLISRNEVFPRLRKWISRNGKVSNIRGTGSEKTRSSVSRGVAIDRWRTVVKHGRQWRPPQKEHETSLEYTRSLIGAISITGQIMGRDGEPLYDAEALGAAVCRLSQDYVQARYSSAEEQDENLILRNENGEADKDLEIVTRAAGRIPRGTAQTVEVVAEGLSYLQRPLTADPLNMVAEPSVHKGSPSNGAVPQAQD